MGCSELLKISWPNLVLASQNDQFGNNNKKLHNQETGLSFQTVQFYSRQKPKALNRRDLEKYARNHSGSKYIQ